MRRYLVVVGVIFVVIVPWILVLSPGAVLRTSPLDSRRFERVEVGMTLAEAERVLGAEPGYYGKYSSQGGIMTLEGLVCEGSQRRVLGREVRWFDDDDRFEVCLDRRDRVVRTNERGWESNKGLDRRIMRIIGL